MRRLLVVLVLVATALVVGGLALFTAAMVLS